MYLSRGNPVIYYGDEQGFVGDGGDQLARQDMFPSQVARVQRRRPDRDRRDDRRGQLRPVAPAVQGHRRAGRADARRIRRCATARSSTGCRAARARACTRSRASTPSGREYVVALNNAEEARSASIPTYSAGGRLHRSSTAGGVRDGAHRRREAAAGHGAGAVGGRLPRRRASRRAAARAVHRRSRGSAAPERLEVERGRGRRRLQRGHVPAPRRGRGGWRPIGTDDNRALPRVPRRVGPRARHEAAVPRRGARLRRATRARAAPVDARGRRRRHARVAHRRARQVRGKVQVRAVAAPERAPLRRRRCSGSVGGGPWTTIGTDSSSPAYTAFDDISALAPGTSISYRAILDYGAGTVTSAEPVGRPSRRRRSSTAIVHYQRPDGDYGGVGPAPVGRRDRADVAHDLGRRRGCAARTDDFGAVFEIPLADDIQPVKFIVHKPNLDAVPTRTGGDRFFVPALHPEIWLSRATRRSTSRAARAGDAPAGSSSSAPSTPTSWSPPSGSRRPARP